jgi:hypothetical protein
VVNPQVLGKRRVAELLYRQTDDGQFVLVPAKPIDPAVRDMLAAGLLQIEGPPPDPRRYCLAALKHAYLAACLYLREIPDTDHARAVRADLLAARDASSSELLPASAAASALGLARSYTPPKGPPLALIAIPREPNIEPEVWISLAGTMAVQWPLPGLPPGTWAVVP